MTAEQEQYIINNWNKMSCQALRKQFNKDFGTLYKTTAFHYHTKRLGLSKHIEHKYTAEQDAFLRDNSNKMSRKELTNQFNARFNSNVKEQTIEQRCFQKGWQAKTDGKFKIGDVPWCKTKGGRSEYIKTLAGGNSASFKKGNVPHNVIDIGTVKMWGHELKIKTDNGWQNRLRYIWEQTYGSIPKGYVVISVDGDKNTNDVDKLRLISNKTLTILMSNRWHDKGTAIVDTGIAWCKLYESLTQK